MKKNIIPLCQTFLAKNTEQGFTLIELLVVIIITGILTAVALPSLLNQIGKAREIEAKEALSSIGLAQQAYFFEKRQFATSLSELKITVTGEYYNYLPPVVTSAPSKVIHVADAINATNQNTRDYAIGVYFQNQSFGIVLCQSNNPGDNALPSSTTLGTCQQGQIVQ